MNNVINFIVSFEDKVFTADATNAPIVTAGKTLDELLANIKDAVKLYFDDELTKSPFFTLVYSEQVKYA